MLIDKTFFEGQLSVGQITEESIQVALQTFIDEYEPELLRRILGIPLYNEFKAGLLEDPVEDKWLDLLYGCHYADGSKYWKGLIIVPDGVTAGYYIPEDKFIVVDQQMVNDNSITDNSLANKNYRVKRRGTGSLQLGTEYQVSVDKTVISNFTNPLDLNETIVIEFLDPVALPAGSGSQTASAHKYSLIANYVYYWYLRDQASFNSGIGENVTVSKNAKSVNHSWKMAKAWNKMAKDINDLRDYLLYDTSLYPSYSDIKLDKTSCELLKSINPLGF